MLISRTNVASVGSVFNETRKVKVFSKGKIDVLSKGPSSGVSSGGSGKTTRVFIRVNTKTSRDKIKANQMVVQNGVINRNEGLSIR